MRLFSNHTPSPQIKQVPMKKRYPGILPDTFEKSFQTPFLQHGLKFYLSNSISDFDFFQEIYSSNISDKGATYRAEVSIDANLPSKSRILCTCKTFSRHSKCQHVAALLFKIYELNDEKDFCGKTHHFYFTKSVSYMLSKNCSANCGASSERAGTQWNGDKKQLSLVFKTKQNQHLFNCVVAGDSARPLLLKHRRTLFTQDWQQIESAFSFKKAYWEAGQLIASERRRMEKIYGSAGFTTPKQQYYESFWYDLGKYWYFEFENREFGFDFDIRKQLFKIHELSGQFEFFVERKELSLILGMLAARPIHRKRLLALDEETYLDYSIKIDDDLNLKFSPLLVAPKSGQTFPLSSVKNLHDHIFGKFIYLDGQGFIPFIRKEFFLDPKYFPDHEVTVPNDEIPVFLEKYKKYIDQGKFYEVSPSLKNQKIVKTVKNTDITFDRFHEHWCFLSLNYTIANKSVSFFDIYQAIQAKKSFVIVDEHWIDTQLPEFSWMQSLNPGDVIGGKQSESGQPQLKLSKINFWKLYSAVSKKSTLAAADGVEPKLKQFIELKPSKKVPSLKSCQFKLRDYQNIGYQWLWYLYENKLAGLLCDDMGLGKTYQSIALLHAVKQQKPDAKFLIVCPTSVLHHWRNKISLIEGVQVRVYHGADRELKRLPKAKCAAIITSYGIIRRDLEQLTKINFDVAIYDEIQSAKNKSSQTFSAVSQMGARTTLGLTGTPIENDLLELKALFDIVLPGYLESDQTFKEQFARPIEEFRNKTRQKLLQRLIQPFTLRRTKTQVLTELPEKVEEIRTCELSPDQVKLYRDVVQTQAGTLIQQLENEEEKIPYLHIFAVLNYLKQICNHPAQLKESELDYTKYSSGKWDLFCELMEESLNSGLKIVVFSQYLNMLALIEAYLKKNQIEFATIKGDTRNREEMLDRFNTDPACRVLHRKFEGGGSGRRPDRRLGGDSLRSLVECRARGSGHRPGAPARSNAGRTSLQTGD